jgi:pimeloyl-ACP methyl ester carboxylesterase
MDTIASDEPRRRRIGLPGRGEGEMAVLEFGPEDRQVDFVFLHANGFNALTYRRILLPLAARFRFLVIDQRGHGATTLPANPEGRRDWQDLADDLTAVIASQNFSAPMVAGHSFGGAAALLSAAAPGSRIRRLVLFDPVIFPFGAARPSPEAASESPLARGALRRRSVFASREAALESYRGRGAFATWPEAILIDYAAAGFVDRPDGMVQLACAPEWEASSYANNAHDEWAAFGASRCPIDIYCAEKNSTCRIDEGRAFLTGRGGVRTWTVPGSSHFLPMERPDVVVGALAAALEQPGG